MSLRAHSLPAAGGKAAVAIYYIQTIVLFIPAKAGIRIFR